MSGHVSRAHRQVINAANLAGSQRLHFVILLGIVRTILQFAFLPCVVEVAELLGQGLESLSHILHLIQIQIWLLVGFGLFLLTLNTTDYYSNQTGQVLRTNSTHEYSKGLGLACLGFPLLGL